MCVVLQSLTSLNCLRQLAAPKQSQRSLDMSSSFSLCQAPERRIRGISVVCICWQTNDRPDREAGFYTLPHPTLHYIWSLKGEWFHIEWIYYIFLPKVSGNPQIFSVTVSYSWPDGNYRLLWGVSCSSNKEKKKFFFNCPSINFFCFIHFFSKIIIFWHFGLDKGSYL